MIRAPMSPSMAAISGGEEASAAHTILGRIGEPEEVAEVAEFLLSAARVVHHRPDDPGRRGVCGPVRETQ